MSQSAIGLPGFGIGAHFGTPVTIASASSTTVNITGAAYITTQYMFGIGGTALAAGNDAALIALQAVTTSNGVTGTYNVSTGAGGTFWNDNTSFRVANLSSVSVNICLIPA